MKSFKITRKASIAKNNEEFDFMEKLEKALPAISLSSHTALVTAIANDIGAEYIFAQQVYGYGLKGDSLLAISTSGGASNVIRALQAARAIGLHTIGLTGRGTQRFKGLCDVCISIPLSETSEIQELCIPIYHAICADLEAFFFGGNID
jgi:D-sedoheptulose 7-phosphate isomerase